MRFLLRLVVAMSAAIVILVVGILMLPADRISQLAATQLSNLTGREVTISGDASVTLWPIIGITANNMVIGNASWSDDTPFLTAARATVSIDASALLSGDIRVKGIEADSPVIRLQRNAQDEVNWDFRSSASVTEEDPADAATQITVERLQITDAQVSYEVNGAEQFVITGFNLTLDWPQGGTADFQAELQMVDEPIKIAATISEFDGFLAGQIQSLTTVLEAESGQLRYTGRASLSGAIAGQVEITADDVGRFAGAFGLPMVNLPPGFGPNAQITTDVTLTDQRQLALRALTANLGGTELSGAVDADLRDVPQVTADISANAIDLRQAGQGASTAGSTDAAGSGWSTAVIDASVLAAFNGTIALRAQSVALPTLNLGSTDVLITNDRSRTVFNLRDVAAYNGQVSGQFVLNNRNGLSVGGQLQARGLELRDLLRDAAAVTRLSGRADADLSFLGVGDSIDAIMKSLSGEGGLSVGRGVIEGVDLDSLLGNFDGSGGTTVFDSLMGRFAIDRGVLRNDDLKMGLANFETTGRGQVDLGGQTLDYTITPKALRANQGRGVAVPVRIFGPWAAPQIRADLEAALTFNFEEEIDRAEERLKQQVEQKLEEELGVTRQEGQSVEDAIQDRIEERLTEELLRLFD
ncbi:MAG: AsmA family protein [Pseudomonadota bacterium]